MKVVCTLRRIQDQFGLSTADLERELRVHPRTVRKLLADTEKQGWRLTRAVLHRLILFAHSHGSQAFEVVPHPIWRTFVARQDEIAVFRGTRGSDAPIEDLLNDYLAQLGSHNARLNIPATCEQVQDAMVRLNCLFIGSPKANPASEMALALLWGAKPFQDQARNRARIPVQFLGMAPDHDFGTSALLRAGTWHGFELKASSAGRPRLLGVDWFEPEVYRSYRGSIKDGAVVAACHQPLGTDKPVTTIVIAGYTGLSSMLAANEAAYRSLPEFDPQGTPGNPWYTVMQASYEKRVDQLHSTDANRIVKEGSIEWTAPCTTA